MSATTEEADSGLSRRGLLGGALVGAAGAAGLQAERSGAQRAAAYRRVRVVRLSRLRVNRPISFEYPLAGQPSVLVDLGGRSPGGVGPNRSIVAYSSAVPAHGLPGRPTDRSVREFECPCHQTRYDPERLGSIIQGVATARAAARAARGPRRRCVRGRR